LDSHLSLLRINLFIQGYLLSNKKTKRYEEKHEITKGKEAGVDSMTKLKALSKGSEHAIARPVFKYKSGTLFLGLATLAASAAGDGAGDGGG